MSAPLHVIIDRIRAEAGIKGPDTLVGLIIYTLNEVFREYTARRRFDVLWMPRTELVPVGAASPVFELPANLQVLQKDDLTFALSGNYDEAYSLFYKGPKRGSIDGEPWSVERQGNTLTVWPYSDITLDSRLIINYWRFPTEMISKDSVCEIPEIEPVIIKETIARISRQGSSDVMTTYIRDAQRSYAASFGVDPQR